MLTYRTEFKQASRQHAAIELALDFVESLRHFNTLSVQNSSVVSLRVWGLGLG